MLKSPAREPGKDFDTILYTLNELGYNAGPVDGLIGGKTRNAMSDAFKLVGKEWDRELDEGDLAILKDILKQKTNGEPKTLAAAKTISASDLGLPINYGENHEPYVDFAGFEDDLINLSKITCIYSTGEKAKNVRQCFLLHSTFQSMD